MIHAYSYIRFSSDKQGQGTSLERQEGEAARYASEHGLTLDNSSYRDLGVSAFKSKNKDEGALGAFIQAVEDGRIRSGSYLLVENFDRLSRDHIDMALELLLGLVRRGIIVVTLQDKQLYSKKSIRENWTKLVTALAIMSRANEEMVAKSDRVKKAWEKNRMKFIEEGRILTKICPAWLKLKDGKWTILEKKANVVRRIFQLAIEGNGSPSIAKILNAEKIPTMAWATEWTFGPIAAILKNHAVFGTLMPKKANTDPIPNYYPTIVEEYVFNEVRARVKSRMWAGGRNTDNVRNLFSGMSFCAQCGSKMRAVSSGGRHTYLRCLSAYSGSGCESGQFPYLAAEKTILRQFHAQNRELIVEPSELKVDVRTAIDSEIAEALKKMDNLIRFVEESGDIASVANRIADLQKKLDALQLKKREVAEVIPDRMQIAQVRWWREQLEELEGDELTKVRLQIQASIRRFLKKIEFDVDGMSVKLTYASGAVRDMSVDEFLEAKGFQPKNKNGKR